jgi:hypothetical protein
VVDGFALGFAWLILAIFLGVRAAFLLRSRR